MFLLPPITPLVSTEIMEFRLSPHKGPTCFVMEIQTDLPSKLPDD